jgi:biotin operon repressor
MKRSNSLKSLEKKIEILNKTLISFEKKLENTNEKINEIVEITSANALRAKTERYAEQIEHTERSERLRAMPNMRNAGTLKKIRGRHREILVMLINNGFHTYKDIAKKLNISQSRVRAYISELKKSGIPLKQIRDPEGYKVGVDLRFVEEILASK